MNDTVIIAMVVGAFLFLVSLPDSTTRENQTRVANATYCIPTGYLVNVMEGIKENNPYPIGQATGYVTFVITEFFGEWGYTESIQCRNYVKKGWLKLSECERVIPHH